MNGTFQDRLVKELREQNIGDIATANIFLKDYLSTFNKKFSVEPRGDSNLHIPLREDEKARFPQIFSEQKLRKVQNDYTIRFETKIIQLYRSKTGGSLVYKGDQIMVEKHLDGTVRVSKDGKYIISKEILMASKACTLPLPPVV